MKSNMKSIVVLTVICVVVSTLLSITNYYTAPIIEANNADAANQSLYVVMPDAEGFETLELSGEYPSTVTGLYKETSGKGYVVTLSTASQYSSDNMGITVAIGNEGTISGVSLTGYYESKDFGADYPQSYVGADSALNGIDTVAGVTYSSTAFKEAIQDAFTLLVDSGVVAEGEKSEEQMIKDILPVIFPGCADVLNAAQLTEVDAQGYKAAYAANNGSGYAVVLSQNDQTVICVVNAFGYGKCYDLEGSEVDGPSAEVAAAFPILAQEKEASNEKNVLKACGENATLTPMDNVPCFDVVTGAYTANVNGQTYYAFNVVPFGYANELMEMVVVMDEQGTIVNYRTITELILHEEYYGAHQLNDKEAYKKQFVGINESTYTDDMPMVAGATCTGNAVADSLHAAFEAFKAVKEAE